jgi:hypothetical protein
LSQSDQLNWLYCWLDGFVAFHAEVGDKVLGQFLISVNMREEIWGHAMLNILHTRIDGLPERRVSFNALFHHVGARDDFGNDSLNAGAIIRHVWGSQKLYYRALAPEFDCVQPPCLRFLLLHHHYYWGLVSETMTANFAVSWLPPELNSKSGELLIADAKSARTREEAQCLRLTSRCCAGVSDRLGELTIGGCSHWSCFLACRHSSFTPHGLLCRGSISGSDHISHRFIHPNCSAPPMRAGLV